MTGDTTPISDEAVSEFKRAYGVMLAFTDVPDERIRQALALTAPLLVSAEAERLQAELDRIAKIPIIAYTLDLEALVEGLRAFAEWVVRLDRPGSEDRITVTLGDIISRAKDALEAKGGSV